MTPLGRPRARLQILAVFLSTLGAGLLAMPRASVAVYECGGVQDTCQCGAANFCICCDNATYGIAHGNCVWYGWHKACCEWADSLAWCTNAETWDNYAVSNGYTVRTGEPCARTVFVCEINTSQCGSGGYGHVGWVETAYPNGSIDVTEQGCYSWYGVKSRLIQAQNASPAMKYIYQMGTSSCSSCQCTVGATENQECGNCGTQSRTCGGDCQWGGWSACSGEGVCAEGATESQECGNCGTQSRTCGSNCQWGSWSACGGEGVCAEGTTQACGTCGGSQTCSPTCTWGTCVETCVDATVPPPDAEVTPDGSVPPADGEPPGPDGTTPPGPDGQIPPDPDGGGPEVDGNLVRGGCACSSSDTDGAALLPLLLFLLLTWGRGARRRRRRQVSSLEGYR